jgi:methylated-DNA-[protein]-cysteine S-methyltransferase
LPYDCSTINKIANETSLENDLMNISTQKIYLGELNNTPLGHLRLAASDLGLIAVEWADSPPALDSLLHRLHRPLEMDESKLKIHKKEILEYLKGRRQDFTFAIDWESLRPFQRKALKAVCKIPYGEIRTYAQIAAKIGHPNAPRAVGRANATNPMPLVIPCHRVIGTDGKLHGYGGGNGLPTKAWLLNMEGVEGH